MFNKIIFILAHQIGDRSFYPIYKCLMKNQWKPYAELREEQDKQLRHMIQYCNDNVPFYHTLFKNLGIQPNTIKTANDLQKIPVLTKDIIKENWEALKPVNLNHIRYNEQSTGGSTGTPMKYRLSSNDRFLGGALLYRGWSYSGYNISDRMVFLAGSSLDTGTKSGFLKKAHEYTRNIRKLSSFDMSELEMRHYADVLKSFRPKFVRGYASSIYFYAQWLEENDITIPFPDAVFTTAEKLFPHMRKTIGRVFCCNVFDGYGLNDGGISAYECSEHSGLHIDTERSILEVVDRDGFQFDEGEGHILATSLNNYAMPFLRYATGDDGFIIEDSCPCGRGHRLLKEIQGRQQSMLITPEGKYIHGEYFTHIFWEIPHVKEFQVVQETLDKIQIKIVKEDGFNEEKLEIIKKIILSKSPNWRITFIFVDEIKRTGAGKFKFIINELTTNV